MGKDGQIESVIYWNSIFMVIMKELIKKLEKKKYIICILILFFIATVGTGCGNVEIIEPIEDGEIVEITGLIEDVETVEATESIEDVETFELAEHVDGVGTVSTANDEDRGFMTTNLQGMIPLESEFYEIISENPIDQAFTLETSEVAERLSNAKEYSDAWENEIKNTLEILKEFLAQEDYLYLQEAYEGWQQYMNNMMSTEIKLFYIGSEYKNAVTGNIIGDENTYPKVMELKAMRMKEYAIELKALEYSLTGEVKFVYTVSDIEE